MKDISNSPYSEFLESAVKTIFGMEPASICIVALMDDGGSMTGYYKSDQTDKANFINAIRRDLVLDIIDNNMDEIAEKLKERLEGLGNDQEEG